MKTFTTLNSTWVKLALGFLAVVLVQPFSHAANVPYIPPINALILDVDCTNFTPNETISILDPEIQEIILTPEQELQKEFFLADWQIGEPSGVDGSAIGGEGGPEPTGGRTGAKAIGTKIGTLYTRDDAQVYLGFPFTRPSLIPLLVTFDSAVECAKFTIYEWIDTGGDSGDIGRIYIASGSTKTPAEVQTEENLAYTSDGNSEQMWRPITFDVSQYVETGFIIVFEFSADADNFRAMGWYLDDLIADLRTTNPGTSGKEPAGSSTNPHTPKNLVTTKLLEL